MRGVPLASEALGFIAVLRGHPVCNSVAPVDRLLEKQTHRFGLVRYAEFHRNLETYALAGLKAGQSAGELAAAYTPPASLTDFSFMEPFANNFIQLLSDETSAR